MSELDAEHVPPDAQADEATSAPDDDRLFGMTDEQVAENFSPINIRNLSIKCGRCQNYQTLASFERRGPWNHYTYECEQPPCDPNNSRTVIEVPAALDEFARRDPGWRGGKRHAGAQAEE